MGWFSAVEIPFVHEGEDVKLVGNQIMRPIKDVLVERCQESLSRELGLENRVLLDALVCHSLGMRTNKPLAEVFDSLTAAGFSFFRIMAAVKRCEVLHIESLLSEMVSRPLGRQTAELRQIQAHYDAVRQRWVDEAESRVSEGDNEQQSHACEEEPIGEELLHTVRSLDDDQESGDRDARLIERTLQHFQQHGELQLFNYFYELQVGARSHVESVESPYLTLGLTPKLERVFAAGEKMRYAYAPTTDPERVLRMELHGARGDQVVLRAQDVLYHPQGRRLRVRVRMVDYIPVTVKRNGRRWKARMLDLSENGLGLLFDRSVDIGLGDEVLCTCALRTVKHTIELQARGVVHWQETEDHQIRLGVGLNLTSGEQLKLQNALMSYEQTIIQKLRSLGTPDLLR